MILLYTTRQYVETAMGSFFPYVELLKQTKLNNVCHLDPRHDEFLQVVAINCILAEIQTVFHKKLLNTKSRTMKFEFTNAQGIVLFKTLNLLPTGPGKEYLQIVLADWIGQLDQEMIFNHIHETSKATAYAG